LAGEDASEAWEHRGGDEAADHAGEEADRLVKKLLAGPWRRLLRRDSREAEWKRAFGGVSG
jgi:hypothetical protein